MTKLYNNTDLNFLLKTFLICFNSDPSRLVKGVCCKGHLMNATLPNVQAYTDRNYKLLYFIVIFCS